MELVVLLFKVLVVAVMLLLVVLVLLMVLVVNDSFDELETVGAIDEDASGGVDPATLKTMLSIV